MKRLLLLCVCACLCATSAWANDIINWGQLGGNQSILSTYQSWTSQSGQFTGTVGNVSDGTFQRVDQGSGWTGNFSPGEKLIWNQGGAYSQEIDLGIFFDHPVAGGGAQIQARFYGEFWASIMAFDINDNMIGEVEMMGHSNGNGDDSAIFISFLSEQRNVHLIEFNVYDINGGDSFAIGQFTIYPNAATPEPGSFVLVGTGLLTVMAGIRRRFAK